MSSLISVRRKSEVQIDTSRIRQLQQTARQSASMAAERVGPLAARSREYAAERVLQARRWSAPRLERAAGYVEQDLAPRLSAWLNDTARRIEPPAPADRPRNTGLLVLAAIAALGAAGAAMTRRNAFQTPYEHYPQTAYAEDGTPAH